MLIAKEILSDVQTSITPMEIEGYEELLTEEKELQEHLTAFSNIEVALASDTIDLLHDSLIVLHNVTVGEELLAGNSFKDKLKAMGLILKSLLIAAIKKVKQLYAKFLVLITKNKSIKKMGEIADSINSNIKIEYEATGKIDGVDIMNDLVHFYAPLLEVADNISIGKKFNSKLVTNGDKIASDLAKGLSSISSMDGKSNIFVTTYEAVELKKMFVPKNGDMKTYKLTPTKEVAKALKSENGKLIPLSKLDINTDMLKWYMKYNKDTISKNIKEKVDILNIALDSIGDVIDDKDETINKNSLRRFYMLVSKYSMISVLRDVKVWRAAIRLSFKLVKSDADEKTLTNDNFLLPAPTPPVEDTEIMDEVDEKARERKRKAREERIRKRRAQAESSDSSETIILSDELEWSLIDDELNEFNSKVNLLTNTYSILDKDLVIHRKTADVLIDILSDYIDVEPIEDDKKKDKESMGIKIKNILSAITTFLYKIYIKLKKQAMKAYATALRVITKSEEDRKALVKKLKQLPKFEPVDISKLSFFKKQTIFEAKVYDEYNISAGQFLKQLTFTSEEGMSKLTKDILEDLTSNLKKARESAPIKIKTDNDKTIEKLEKMIDELQPNEAIYGISITTATQYGFILIPVKEDNGKVIPIAPGLKLTTPFWILYLSRAKVEKQTYAELVGMEEDFYNALTISTNAIKTAIKSKVKRLDETYKNFSKAVGEMPDKQSAIYMRSITVKTLGEYATDIVTPIIVLRRRIKFAKLLIKLYS